MNRITILRKEHGDHQTDLAAYLGISQARLSNWEREVNQPPKEMLFKIAERYGVSTDYLMGFSESREIPESEPIRLLREYLGARFSRECEANTVQRLDSIICEIMQLWE